MFASVSVIKCQLRTAHRTTAPLHKFVFSGSWLNQFWTLIFIGFPVAKITTAVINWSFCLRCCLCWWNDLNIFSRGHNEHLVLSDALHPTSPRGASPWAVEWILLVPMELSPDGETWLRVGGGCCHAAVENRILDNLVALCCWRWRWRRSDGGHVTWWKKTKAEEVSSFRFLHLLGKLENVWVEANETKWEKKWIW